jgi:outer membrane protein OmpA-like peptidoglycan-associated protein
VNQPAALELQACRNDLQNARLLGAESDRRADAASATLARLTARHPRLLPVQQQPEQQGTVNRVFSIRFDFGSTQATIPAAATAGLMEAAKASPLVLLRGRTDGSRDTLEEARIARTRAETVRDYLVAGGVDPARIRTTYQPAGDPVAENVSATGRQLNRRVEVELYRVLPVPLYFAQP